MYITHMRNIILTNIYVILLINSRKYILQLWEKYTYNYDVI